MWGDQYQVLVATHFNTGTYHNHLVVNAVNLWNGKKFNCNEGAYWKLRSLSDALCRAHGLTVIQNPKGKTPRKLYFAEKNGEPTRYNLMREAIEKALTMSTNEKAFRYVMKKLGYVVEWNPYHKYATIRSVNSKKATRLYRLGEAYDRDALYQKIYDNGRYNRQETYRSYHAFTAKKPYGMTIQPRRYRMKGNFQSAKKITGLRALYLHYCYLLGVFPKQKQRRPLSPEMREACRKLDRYSEQVRLVCKQKLTDISSVGNFIQTAESEIKLLIDYRKILYRKIDSCHQPEEKQTLLAKRNDCTKVITQLRKDKKTALGILKDYPEIKEKIRIEEQMRQRKDAPNKNRKRGYER